MTNTHTHKTTKSLSLSLRNTNNDAAEDNMRDVKTRCNGQFISRFSEISLVVSTSIVQGNKFLTEKSVFYIKFSATGTSLSLPEHY
jgi:hypothetical protein